MRATAGLALVGAGLAGCANGAKTTAGAAPNAEVATSTTGFPPTTTVTSTSPPTGLPAPTTTSPAPTTTGSPAPTTTVSPVPTTQPPLPGNTAGYIHATYEAWAAGDRAAAAPVAEAAAVDSLFARIWSEADGWVFLRCEGAAGSVFCVWQRPGEQLLIKARNTAGGEPVNAVEFRASP